jgi:hypothetical protein
VRGRRALVLHCLRFLGCKRSGAEEEEDEDEEEEEDALLLLLSWHGPVEKTAS